MSMQAHQPMPGFQQATMPAANQQLQQNGISHDLKNNILKQIMERLNHSKFPMMQTKSKDDVHQMGVNILNIMLQSGNVEQYGSRQAVVTKVDSILAQFRQRPEHMMSPQVLTGVDAPTANGYANGPTQLPNGAALYQSRVQGAMRLPNEHIPTYPYVNDNNQYISQYQQADGTMWGHTQNVMGRQHQTRFGARLDEISPNFIDQRNGIYPRFRQDSELGRPKSKAEDMGNPNMLMQNGLPVLMNGDDDQDRRRDSGLLHGAGMMVQRPKGIGPTGHLGDTFAQDGMSGSAYQPMGQVMLPNQMHAMRHHMQNGMYGQQQMALQGYQQMPNGMHPMAQAMGPAVKYDEAAQQQAVSGQMQLNSTSCSPQVKSEVPPVNGMNAAQFNPTQVVRQDLDKSNRSAASSAVIQAPVKSELFDHLTQQLTNDETKQIRQIIHCKTCHNPNCEVDFCKPLKQKIYHIRQCNGTCSEECKLLKRLFVILKGLKGVENEAKVQNSMGRPNDTQSLASAQHIPNGSVGQDEANSSSSRHRDLDRSGRMATRTRGLPNPSISPQDANLAGHTLQPATPLQPSLAQHFSVGQSSAMPEIGPSSRSVGTPSQSIKKSPSQAEVKVEPGSAKAQAVSIPQRRNRRKTLSLAHCLSKDQLKWWIKTCQEEMKKPEYSKRVVPDPDCEEPCQVCKQEKLLLEPPVIMCSLCGNKVNENHKYYIVEQRDYDEFGHHQPSGLGANEGKVTYKMHHGCVRDQAAEFELDGQKFYKKDILKLEKQQPKLDKAEQWVQCDQCYKWVHFQCALFNDSYNQEGKGNGESQSQFYCPCCILADQEKGLREVSPRTSDQPQASDLPKTQLSEFLEKRLSEFLKKEKADRASASKDEKEVVSMGDWCIRVLCNQTRTCPTFEHIQQEFGEYLPQRHSFLQRTIALFQNINGCDVLIYCVYVYEYGDKEYGPNRNSVYLSYLDSTKYFVPEIKVTNDTLQRSLRTLVYQNILKSYLAYIKRLGFTQMSMWSCPPEPGDDYIMFAHPPSSLQKIPTAPMLRNWYKNMVDDSIKEGIVNHRSTYFDWYFQAGRDNSAYSDSVLNLPQYEGDYWCGELDHACKEMRREGYIEFFKKFELSDKRGAAKRNQAATSQSSPINAKPVQERLMTPLGKRAAERYHKEDFLIVHLYTPCSCCRKYLDNEPYWYLPQSKGTTKQKHYDGLVLSDVNQLPNNYALCQGCYQEYNRRIKSKLVHNFPSGINITDLQQKHAEPIIKETDPDPQIESDFFKTRNGFLTLQQGNNYQFDMFRRAAYSTMMIIWHICNPREPAFASNCNECGCELERGRGWRCKECPDYDLCDACKQKGLHKHHAMQSNSAPSKMSWTQQKMQQFMAHANQCTIKEPQTCLFSPYCYKFRSRLEHVKQCQLVSQKKNCPICYNSGRFITMHSKYCTLPNCDIPYCLSLRRRQEQAQRRHQQQLYSRRRRHYEQSYNMSNPSTIAQTQRIPNSTPAIGCADSQEATPRPANPTVSNSRSAQLLSHLPRTSRSGSIHQIQQEDNINGLESMSRIQTPISNPIDAAARSMQGVVGNPNMPSNLMSGASPHMVRQTSVDMNMAKRKQLYNEQMQAEELKRQKAVRTAAGMATPSPNQRMVAAGAYSRPGPVPNMPAVQGGVQAGQLWSPAGYAAAIAQQSPIAAQRGYDIRQQAYMAPRGYPMANHAAQMNMAGMQGQLQGMGALTPQHQALYMQQQHSQQAFAHQQAIAAQQRALTPNSNSLKMQSLSQMQQVTQSSRMAGQALQQQQNLQRQRAQFASPGGDPSLGQAYRGMVGMAGGVGLAKQQAVNQAAMMNAGQAMSQQQQALVLQQQQRRQMAMQQAAMANQMDSGQQGFGADANAVGQQVQPDQAHAVQQQHYLDQQNAAGAAGAGLNGKPYY